MITLKHPLTASERSQLAACMSARGPDTTSGLNAALGRFRYSELGGGQIRISDPAWVRSNIVEVEVASELPGWPVNSLTGRPQRKLFVHRIMRPALLLAWREIRARGLAGRLRTYDGLWVPRHKLHNPANDLSVHSWAAAIDLDARWNGYGVTPVIDPAVIQVFELFGFTTGYRWRPADGMHVQYSLPLPGTAVPAWQDGALRVTAAPVIPALPPTPAVPTPAAPAYVRPPRVFLRAVGDANTEMDDKAAHYGGGTVIRLDSGQLRFTDFSGELGVYFDHAVQLDRLPEEHP